MFRRIGGQVLLRAESSSLFCVPIRLMRILNVAEKNDAAKSIARILSKGSMKSRQGGARYNMIYEFKCRALGVDAEMIMTSVSGHLLNLDFSGVYRNWRNCDPVLLFEAPIDIGCERDNEQIKKMLIREARSCEKLIIWTDCDREGENIGFQVIDVCKQSNRSLQIFRAKFSEIADVSINRAIANLCDPDKSVSDAVDARKELDLRIGAAFTRLQTLRLQRSFPNSLGQCLISYGSCQFPTLGFVVDRYKCREEFIEEPFWKLEVYDERTNSSALFSWKRGRLFDHYACVVLYDKLMSNPTALVTSAISRPKKKWRPQPMNTVALERLSSRFLKITAKETMKIAEKLYTSGLISYPRTETDQFAKEIDLDALVRIQCASPENWASFAKTLADEWKPNPRNGNKTDSAHPPIHPTNLPKETLVGNEKRVYELVTRHFLACLSKDAEGLSYEVTIKIDEEIFNASGLSVIAENYLLVYPYEKWTDKQIPKYDVDERFVPKSIMMVDGKTSPPELLTEADLIALMDKHGIGTDATHAEHIETIKTRGYVMSLVTNSGLFFVYSY